MVEAELMAGALETLGSLIEQDPKAAAHTVRRFAAVLRFLAGRERRPAL